MKPSNDSTKMITVKLSTWQAVLAFLSRHRTDAPTDQVVITKTESTWMVHTTKAARTPTLTSKNRGVGLFDLNW